MKFLLSLMVCWLVLGQEALAAGPIRIGVEAPMTGPLAKQGQDMRNAVQLAIDEHNAKGGARVELVVGDDKGDPREGLLAARQLVAAGVVGVVGPYNSGVAIPVSAEVYDPAHVAILTVATNPKVTERGLRTVFRIIGRDDQQGAIAAKEARRLGLSKAVVLHNKNAYGQGLAEVFAKDFKALGGQVLAIDGIASGEKDFSATLTRLKTLSPDLLFFGGEYQDAGPLARQARRLGLAARFLSGDAALDATFIKLAGTKAAEGALVTFPPPASEAFLARYRKRFGEPGAYSGYAYDGARILLDAAGAGSPALVAAKIAKTKKFPGVTGSIGFDAKGDLTRAGFILWQVKAGQFAPF